MQAFVTQVGRTQYRVHYRVYQYIAITVAGEAPVMGNFHPAQNQLPSFSQRVRVKTDAGSVFRVSH